MNIQHYYEFICNITINCRNLISFYFVYLYIFYLFKRNKISEISKRERKEIIKRNKTQRSDFLSFVITLYYLSIFSLSTENREFKRNYFRIDQLTIEWIS